MSARFVRTAVLILAVCAGGIDVRADDAAEFNALVDAAEAHNRLTLDYLQAGNSDLAALELGRLRQAWGDVNTRFSGKRPVVFEDKKLYVTLMTNIATQLVAADLMLNTGRSRVARQALLAVRDDLDKLRKSAGVVEPGPRPAPD